MLSFTIPINDNEINTIREIIEENSGSPCSIRKNFQTIWYVTEDESEFRISFLGNLKIIISRVEFVNKRKGTMTRLCDFLKEICIKYSIKDILIQSTQTKEIVNFCNKYGFHPTPYASYYMDGIIVGDYSLTVIDNEEV